MNVSNKIMIGSFVNFKNGCGKIIGQTLIGSEDAWMIKLANGDVIRKLCNTVWL